MFITLTQRENPFRVLPRATLGLAPAAQRPVKHSHPVLQHLPLAQPHGAKKVHPRINQVHVPLQSQKKFTKLPEAECLLFLSVTPGCPLVKEIGTTVRH